MNEHIEGKTKRYTKIEKQIRLQINLLRKALVKAEKVYNGFSNLSSSEKGFEDVSEKVAFKQYLTINTEMTKAIKNFQKLRKTRITEERREREQDNKWKEKNLESREEEIIEKEKKIKERERIIILKEEELKIENPES